MKNIKFSLLIGLCICLNTLHAQSLKPKIGVAPTPPMGWNSYNCYGATVEEAEVKANAQYLAKNMKQYGWQYVVIDFCWFYPHPPGSHQDNPPQYQLPKGGLVPWMPMDKYGRLLPDPRKFPSSAGGKGFKPMADYVHSLGLKFGIHVMRGIPRQAYWEKTPILGTQGITADMVGDTSSKCPWLNSMWGVDMTKGGSQAYYNSIFKLYAEWGVDYVKVDDTDLDEKYPYRRSEVEAMRKAIANCGRPIVLSLSLNMKYENRDHAVQNAELWRISKDFWDSWEQVEEQFELCAKWASVTDKNAYPDADMLQIGKIAKRGPVGKERYSRLTEDEHYTHITLWSIARSPLMMGGNLPENTPFVLQLLTNPEVIAVNQKSIDAKQLYRKDDVCVWVSKMSNSKDLNVAFFNLGKEAKDIKISWEELGLTGNYKVRDLWAKQDIGSFSGAFNKSVNSHGAKIFRFTL
jgi:alpha-galactosidase